MSLIKRHGGKHYLAQWIVETLPDTTGRHYVEPYFGAGSVLFALPDGDRSEVVNDLDLNLSTFWRMVRDRGDELKHYLSMTPFSKVEYDAANAILRCSESHVGELARAAAFMVANRQSRQGLEKSFATLVKNRTRRSVNENASAWMAAVDLIDAYMRRLRSVVILADDALSVIKKEDSPNTVFYLDPPYMMETRTAPRTYSHEMDSKAHEALLKTLESVSGQFALSCYTSELYESFARKNGWQRYERTIDNKASSAKTKSERIEVLWVKRNQNANQNVATPLSGS